MWVHSLGREDPLEKKVGMHSSVLAWESPHTEGPGRLQSTGSQRVRHDFTTKQQLSCLNFKKYSHFYFSKLNNPEKLTVWCMLPAGSPSAGAPMMAVKAFGASLPKWRYKEKLRVLLRRGCHQHPSVLTPWSWASSLQNHGKYIPAVCKPVSLWGLLQQPWGTKAHVGAPFPSVLLLFSH